MTYLSFVILLAFVTATAVYVSGRYLDHLPRKWRKVPVGERAIYRRKASLVEAVQLCTPLLFVWAAAELEQKPAPDLFGLALVCYAIVVVVEIYQASKRHILPAYWERQFVRLGLSETEAAKAVRLQLRPWMVRNKFEAQYRVANTLRLRTHLA